ncbi:Helix-turn-helix domain protein [Rickettsiales bacterium Ac37b]|nr:Helix-turn-helix domain protein [Rickettsiales bacterium Ac37b]
MIKNHEDITMPEKLLTRKEAAEFLGIAENTLAVWACTKRYDLPMVKIGKLIRYKLSDLIKFIDQHQQ